MGIEIERKFLIKSDAWKALASKGKICRQGYMVSDPKRTVRVRVMDDTGYLTVKGAAEGFSRMEFEYEIDKSDAEYMLLLCDRLVEKTRHVVKHDGLIWEVDVFEGANAGLVMAEVELHSEEQEIELPDWAGVEVTDDPRYYNAYLATHPFQSWLS